MRRPPFPQRRPDLDREDQIWRGLRLFQYYRLMLVVALTLGFVTTRDSGVLGGSQPDLFIAGLAIHLGFIISSGLLLVGRSPSSRIQVRFALLSDILALTLLMESSGGVASGLGLLIAISITVGSLLVSGRMALLFAALASLAVLAATLYGHLSGRFSAAAYTQAGLLGLTFFALALVAHGLSRRLQESERLARQRGLDLANLAQLNEYIIQHMNTGVLVADQGLRLRLMNRMAWQLLGRPPVKRGDPLARACPTLPKLILAWRRDPRPPPPLFRPHPSGQELKPGFAALGGNAEAGTLIFLEDNSRILQQAQQMKLASLGRLTASIAHEIRNPLGAISHAGQLLAESPELNPGDRRLTQIIKSNADRVNAIIETVLRLSRREQARPDYLPLDDWLGTFLTEFTSSRLLDPALFQFQARGRGFLVLADPQQLGQVLGNLCDNALKHGACDPRSPLVVQLRGPDAPGALQPTLELRDQGPGIPPELSRQIFEPFFTTGAKGTGLGLYIAKELCEINRISLEYLPVPTGGSCFRLTFHLWKATPTDEHAPRPTGG